MNLKKGLITLFVKNDAGFLFFSIAFSLSLSGIYITVDDQKHNNKPKSGKYKA